MKRLSAFGLSLMMLGLAMFPLRTLAQQKSLKEQLVGAWELVSCDRMTAKGAKQPYCVNPNGILILDASGRYAHIIGARGRAKLNNLSHVDAPAEQYAAAARAFVANFGTWSVNETDSTLVRHYEGSIIPNFEGTDSKMPVSIVGDELTLTGHENAADLDHGRYVTVYRRVK